MAFRVAERWFERVRVDDDIILIREPHVDPLGRCNIWHVRGSEADLLVDTGMGIAELRPAIADLFGHAVIAVATHAHFDHVGGMHEFDQRIASRREAEVVQRGDERFALYRDDMDPATVVQIEAGGYAIGACLIDAVPYADYEARAYRVPPFTPTRTVADGDEISIGNRRFEVLELPGHSPGSIGLWESATGTLFSGDAVYDGPLLDTFAESDIGAYCRTMERLLELPVSVVHAGHDPSFGRGRLRQICRAYLDSCSVRDRPRVSSP